MTIWPHLLPVLLLGSFCRSLQVTEMLLHRKVKATFVGCFGFVSTSKSLSPSAPSQPWGCFSCLLWSRLWQDGHLFLIFVYLWFLFSFPQRCCFNIWKYSLCIKSHSFQSRPLCLTQSGETNCLKIIYALLPLSAFHVPFTDCWKIQILMMSKSENLQYYLVGREK